MSQKLTEQEVVRRDNLQKIIELGINPYPNETFDMKKVMISLKKLFLLEG